MISNFVTTTTSFDNLDARIRKCKSQDETEGLISLNQYTKVGCEYECAAKQASDLCKCVPWFFPTDFKGNLEYYFPLGGMDNLSIIKSMLFCLSVPFLTPFPWTNLRARYIYGFLFTWWRYWDHELIGESLFKKFYLSHSEKCPSKHAAICPSKYELCVLPSMKLELRNKSSPLQLAPKPTHTQRENIMGPKAPIIQVP